ncbi:MAG: hypothetical protein HY695_13925 [Deltaproteobacteria bacterium]|nr:hypothetical protein [Deltaproteobacteria bacterium]
MRIIVMGAGPIGGIVGGRLARAGNNVTLVDIDVEHVRSIRERGLRVDVPDGPFTVSLPALLPYEVQGQFDMGFIAVRSNYTGDVLAFLASHLDKNAVLVSLQNGINLPLLEEVVGSDRAIGTVIRMRSRRLDLGHVQTEQRGRLYIGHLHGKTTAQVEAVSSLLNTVIPTETISNIFGLLWSKLTYTCLGLFGSLADESLKVICETEVNRRLCVDFLGEVVSVGKATGARFEPLAEYDPLDFHPSRPLDARLCALVETSRNWKSDDRRGPVQQLKRRMRTEVDQTIGYVAENGDKLNIPTPLCRALVRMIHEIEKGKRPLQIRNYAELADATSFSG